MSLEQQAADRKSRLAALKNKRKPTTQEVQDESADQRVKKQTSENDIVSRNFDRQTQDYKKGYDAPPTTLDENSETVEAVSLKIQNEILSKLSRSVEAGFQSAQGGEESTWKKGKDTRDFMRDLQPKLDVLKSRTDEALGKILRERIRKLKEIDESA